MHTACSSSHQVGGSASVHAEIHPPGVGLETPLGVGLETPQVWAWRPPWVWAWRLPRCGPGDPLPLARPLNFCLGCGPGDPHPARPLKLQPWVWSWKPAKHAGIHPSPQDLQGMLGYHLQGMLGYYPPMNRQTREKT